MSHLAGRMFFLPWQAEAPRPSHGALRGLASHTANLVRRSNEKSREEAARSHERAQKLPRPKQAFVYAILLLRESLGGGLICEANGYVREMMRI